MAIRTLQRAFAGGEVTPELFGRIDDVKYAMGLAKCRNFITKPQGLAENRAGTEYVRAVKDSTKKTRLIPFTYSTTQTMVLEFGDQYVRFHTDASTLLAGTPAAWVTATPYVVGDLVSEAGNDYYCITAHTSSAAFVTDAAHWYALPAAGEYEIPAPYAEADLFDLHYVQSADVLTIVHPNYAPRELRRYGATNWQLSTVSFAAPIASPSVKVTGNGVAWDYFYQYVVTSVTDEGLNESVASSPAQGTARTLTGITKASPGVLTTSAAHTLAVNNAVYLDDIVGMTELNGNYYVVNTVPSPTTLTLKDAAGNVIDTSAFTAYASGGKLYLSGVKNNLYVTGGANTITWQAVAGASKYNVYKFSGGLFGYIGNTSGTIFIDDNIAPDLSKTPPIYDNPFGSAGNYPAAVSYFEQRRTLAGTTNKPQNIWMTKSGTESDMSYSLPIRDDDRIAFRVAAREANTIRHIVPMSGLILLTSGGEWRVTSVNSDAITPTSISVRQQASVGASNVQPVVVNNTLLYCAARGGHVRELGYQQEAGGFITGDICLRAPHLFDGYTIADMAYSKAPQTIAWFISSNGLLLGLTYVPEQQVGAWHWHDTDGVFESCAVVAEGDEDMLYVVVQRTINGASKRYVERLHTRQFAAQADAFFIDCGLTYSGVPADVISGLSHLEGKLVNILADGAVHPSRVVSGGSITLDAEASTVQVGLPITADLQTLPIAAPLRDGSFGQSHVKNVNKAWLRVYRSSGIFVGPAFDKLREVKQRTTEDYGTPPALKSEELSINLSPSWGDGGQVAIRQSDPLPLTIVCLTAEVELGG